MPKLIFFINEDYYFCSHRLPLAIAAKNNGYDVAVVTRVNRKRELIENAGIRVIPIQFKRRISNPFYEFGTVWSLLSIFRHERPDIVHLVALKPVLYGSLAAYLAGIAYTVNAIAGMGYLFVSDKWMSRLLRLVLTAAFRFLLDRENSRVIVQNPDDREIIVRNRMARAERISLIRGAGVDTEVFMRCAEPQGIVTIVMASRLLWNKGVGEFVEAARMLRERAKTCRFVLVGEPDPENPMPVPYDQLTHWRDSGVIEWWGQREDMPQVFAQCHIVCLPSYYGEGIPKVLIEAASCGRPIITTDTPGCREIVRHGENGLLVPVRDAWTLAEALQQLIDSPGLRERMGAKGREMVLREFSVETVTSQTLALYNSLLDRKIS